MQPDDLIESLRARRLLAIVRGTDPDAALDTVLALFRGGVTLVEVSLTTVGALTVIERARAALGEGAALGAGTVLTPADARDAAAAGASFAVTPGVTAALDQARESGLPVLAGVATPTEVALALAEGATALKLFPASLGGPGYLKALRDPFPAAHFVPVGGVDARAAAAFLAAGALAVGVGGPLIGAAAHPGGDAGLPGRIEEFLRVVEEEQPCSTS
ncbi:bifunctional 4-hydroxy-2-oxoglutarate aldolase/2-dehydro-3-deoxy-phosphogluconate aldolase [Kitasatospora sp. NA04385]|uniref:bifunctional 4-hydroxy-2-oxoglutarate aldolase/2-dehydro-3-deoxy-phosphogluconate aldolase n=1 Tax=Kitasatospora sp. NA04385 TaxID=2742135 RepID=UPI001591BF47|nr:bifunctional 4-hydroxy-2-oxoglutarate aldolase/2-dehydro-3-deoxy-phosphogluconate aldolase [Kitasatospora sp. NA04385]QKW17730.1 bifunctional 4-hydroxy-2-oxoglutarate aldolase/2-dehydro-3-deoxy-phosphogluconate aldolase [Kitasatospora sp. NA04385]